MYEIRTVCHTDVGDLRKKNQDSIFAQVEKIDGQDVGLFIVADGCGGLSSGDQVSRLATSHFSLFWHERIHSVLGLKIAEERLAVNDLLENSIRDINQMALNFGNQMGSKVGSTLSLLLSIDNRYYVKNLGDSRIYLIRRRRMRQLTQDQSLVADMIRNGKISLEESEKFKRKNVLTMCIGFYDEAKSFSASGKIKSGDLFMLCSDGFYNCVDEHEILSGIKKYGVSDELLHRLRKSVPHGKARDNISVILCAYERKRKWRFLLAVAIILAALVLGAILFRNQIVDFVRVITQPAGPGVLPKKELLLELLP